jgi:hypothetical protein
VALCYSGFLSEPVFDYVTAISCLAIGFKLFGNGFEALKRSDMGVNG